MIITETLRERIEQSPKGMEVMIELSFPEGTPVKDVSRVGDRAIRHLFNWKPNEGAFESGYQRDGLESSYQYAGTIRGVKEQIVFERLSDKEREDRELVASHVVQVWPNLKANLT